jgi:hypothetical protein
MFSEYPNGTRVADSFGTREFPTSPIGLVSEIVQRRRQHEFLWEIAHATGNESVQVTADSIGWQSRANRMEKVSELNW